MATLQLASWATNLHYANLTPSVLLAANKSLSNWAGCAIGGFTSQPAPRIALTTTLTPFSGPPTSSILGSTNDSSTCHSSADAQVAALINGIASHVDDYDDTHLQTIIHPTGPVASALLAAAEAHDGPVSGQSFMTALVAGIEAECKLGLAVSPEHYDVGWHITSTTGSIGAAVAVSKLLGLDTNHTAHAIGIASTQVIGMQAFFGSDTKSFHVGRAAQSGMLAALLARQGYTSAVDALEARFGWLHVVSTRENATAYFDQLGTEWEVLKNTFKPYPCGIVMHPVIEAGIELSEEMKNGSASTKSNGDDDGNGNGNGGFAIDKIKAVDLRVNPEVLVLTGKKTPSTGLESKFSIYHAVSIALLYGQATPSQFTDTIVKNAIVVSLRGKVNVTTDKEVPTDAAFVTLRFEDGGKLEKHVQHAKGSVENPLTEGELREKFLGQVELAIGGERAKRAYEVFMGVGAMEDVKGLGGMY